MIIKYRIFGVLVLLLASLGVATGQSENTGIGISDLNQLWMLIAAFLVFFMQAGFKVFEVGLVRIKDRNSVGFKNLMDWLIITVVFVLFGFAIMFGQSENGFSGTSMFGLQNFTDTANNAERGFEFFLFQLGFAAAAATIVSGALAVRMKLVSYMILAALIGIFIYPVFGHLAWGDLLIESNQPFLRRLGFLDFAGSTVVHSVGAWIAITGMWFIRPRIGKINKKDNLVEIRVPNEDLDKFEPHNLGYSVLGVLILWMGWWGFNGGSTDFIPEPGEPTVNSVPLIILNTNIAGVMGGISAFLHCYWFQSKKQLYEKTLGGVLGGLVAITACCNVVGILAASMIGILAGIVHNLAYDRLNNKTVFGKIIDDPVGAIPVHGACGILGTLCVVFGQKDKILAALPEDFGPWNVPYQLGIQFLGILVCAAFTILMSILFFSILKRTIGLEVSIDQEKEGENI